MNDDYFELQKQLSMIRSTLDLNEFQKHLSSTYSALNHVFENKSSISENISMYYQAIAPLKNIIKSHQNFYKDIFETTYYARELIQSLRPGYIENINASVAAMREILSSIPNSSDIPMQQHETFDDVSQIDNAPSDYVTIDESTAKVWNFPKNITIPVGNNKLRINTSDFIAILSIIITIIIALSGSMQPDDTVKDQTIQQYIEVEKEENLINEKTYQILYDFLSSVDASNSSQAESIEDLTKAVQAVQADLSELKDIVQNLEQTVHSQDSAPSSSQESADNDPAMTDNTLE